MLAPIVIGSIVSIVVLVTGAVTAFAFQTRSANGSALMWLTLFAVPKHVRLGIVIAPASIDPTVLTRQTRNLPVERADSPI